MKLLASLLLVACTGCAFHRSHYNIDPTDGRIWFDAKEPGHHEHEIWVFYGDHFELERKCPHTCK